MVDDRKSYLNRVKWREKVSNIDVSKTCQKSIYLLFNVDCLKSVSNFKVHSVQFCKQA